VVITTTRRRRRAAPVVEAPERHPQACPDRAEVA